jgi:hypothetical protein
MPNQRLERSIPQNNQFERNPVRFIGRQGWSCADQYCYARAGGEIIASDVSLLVTFNNAIDGVIQNNPKARANPKALAQLDGYKRPLVSSLSGNLQRFGIEKVGKVESLQEIIAEMAETTETNDRASADCPSPSLSARSDV